MKKTLTAAVVTVAAFAVAPSVQAHEFRDLGKGYIVYVGSYNEPPFSGVINGVDIFPEYNYKAVDGTSQTYFVDQDSGDTVVFNVSEILYSDKPLPVIKNAGQIPQGTLVINTLVPHGPVLPSPIEQKFGSSNLQFSQFGPEYINNYMPLNPGYYGYHIAGVMKIKFANIKPGAGGLNTQGVPGTNVPPPVVTFNQYFICGAGSQDKPNTGFQCFTQPLGVAGIGQGRSSEQAQAK